MKTKYNKKRYKLQAGVQYAIADSPPDMPDYNEAYTFKQQKLAREKAGENIGVAVANTAVPGLGSGMQAASTLTDAMFKDSKGNYKNKTSELLSNQLNPLGKAGKAFSALTGDKSAAADLWSGSLVGTGLGALGVKNPFGKTSQEEGKELVKKEEERVRIANMLKSYKATQQTQNFLNYAKKGKYKVKSKQPRLIETEGREPIFSPKKADGTRDLLYYNPNDPTHEEGGVKAMVVPTAADGKKNTKTNKKPEVLIDKDSWAENIGELFDPTGILSWDDAYRALKNLKNYPKEPGKYVSAGIETLGALPVIGKLKYLAKGVNLSKNIKRAGKFTNVGDWVGDITNIGSTILGDQLSEEGFNYQKGTYKGRSVFPQFTQTYKDMAKAYGAKQLKVNTLNDTSLSENLGGMPAVNAANKFIQPMAGKMQVARQIPEYRRKEKQNTPRSHRKENPDTNRIIDPPMLYEMKPPPPRSTFNTKNDFNKGSKKVKVYR